MNAQYGCALLAGGAGRRFGHKNKAELAFGDESFRDHIAAELRKAFSHCYLSTAVYEQEVPEGYRLVRDVVTDEKGDFVGPMGGIYSCLLQAKEDGLKGLFFAPCDAPFFRIDILEKLEEQLDDSVDAALWLTGDGRLQPAFGYYGVSLLPAAKAELDEKHYQILRVFDHVNTKIVDAERNGVPQHWFLNINCPEEYEHLVHQDPDSKKRDEPDYLTPEDAVERLLEAVRKNTFPITENVPLMKACGRILAEDIRSPLDQPPFPRSPVDGYAVRSEDIAGATKEAPARLTVLAEVDAGGWFTGTVGKGEAVRIMTGAPIPDGADAVLRQEATDYGDKTVKVYEELKPYRNYIFRGEDYKQGDLMMQAGDKLGPVEIGVIAGLGFPEVPVYRRPKVLLLSTGDELMAPGEPLGPGKIYNSNLYSTAAQLEAWGLEVIMEHVPDDPRQAVLLIRQYIADVDMVLSTGGVSVGKKDIMHDVFGLLGVHRVFWKLSLKPGMAMLAGMFENTPVLALSGNPFAAYVDLHLVARPVLAELAKDPALELKKGTAVLQDDYGKRSPGRRMVRASVENGTASVKGHTGGNGDFASGLRTNALIDIPAGTERLSAGETVSVILL